MKTALGIVVVGAALLHAAPVFACSVAPLEGFSVEDSGEGEPPPTPEIRVVEISRASGTDEASCDYLGRLHFRLENPGDYGLLFQVEGKAPFQFRDAPLLAQRDIRYVFDDGDTRGENIDATISVVPISKTGILGEVVALPIAAESDSLVACSTAGQPEDAWLGLLVIGLTLARSRRRDW